MSDPTSPAPKSPSGAGLGTFLVGALLVGGAYYGVQVWQKKQAPLPPPDMAPPATPATSLAKPDALPGGPPKPEPAAPAGDSLSMVKPGADMQGPMERSVMANAYPEPPLSFAGEAGPERARTRVIKTKAEWDKMWQELGGHDIPFVDFDKYMALGVFAGTRPAGTKVELAAKPEGGRLVAHWRLAPPGEPQAGTTQPYTVILVPRTRLAAVFRVVK